jgi:hypothetical protein
MVLLRVFLNYKCRMTLLPLYITLIYYYIFIYKFSVTSLVTFRKKSVDQVTPTFNFSLNNSFTNLTIYMLFFYAFFLLRGSCISTSVYTLTNAFVSIHIFGLLFFKLYCSISQHKNKLYLLSGIMFVVFSSLVITVLSLFYLLLLLELLFYNLLLVIVADSLDSNYQLRSSKLSDNVLMSVILNFSGTLFLYTALYISVFYYGFCEFYLLHNTTLLYVMTFTLLLKLSLGP